MEKMPNSTCWNITSRCNDKCRFCYRDKYTKDLTFEEQKKVIDRVAESGIKKLTFAGGEPLLIPGIEDLVLYAKSKGLLVSMTSNCILMTNERLDFFFEHLDWLTVSLDGANEEMQQAMTRGAGHATRVINVLKAAGEAAKRNCRIKINTVVSNVNKNSIADIAALVSNYPVDRWKLFQFTPVRGNAVLSQDMFLISNELFHSIADDMQSRFTHNNKILSISDSNNIENAYFVIFPNGDIRISTGMKDTHLGNVLEDDICSIWENGGYIKALHEERTGFLLNKVS